MKWELNESKYASGPAQTSSVLKALHMEDEKRPRKTGSLNESMQMNEGITKDCSVGFDIFTDGQCDTESLISILEDALGEYAPNYADAERIPAGGGYDESAGIRFDVNHEVLSDETLYKTLENGINQWVKSQGGTWTGYIGSESIDAYESLQLSGTSKLNGRRNLRRGKENPDNIKTAGNKTKLTGDYDLRESAKTEYQDPYNDKKTWEVTDYDDGHRYLKQKIGGKQFGRGQRTSKKRIKDIGIYDMDKVNENLQESLDDEQCADVLDAITSKVYNGCWSVLEDKFPGSTDCVYEMITKEQFEAAVEKAMLYVEDEYF